MEVSHTNMEVSHTNMEVAHANMEVAHANMEVSHANMIIPCPEEDLILVENVVHTSTGRKKGKADTEPDFPPLPLEKELFIPPVERGSRAERSILVLTETFLGMMPQDGRKIVKLKETADIMKTSIKRVYTICNVLEGIRLMVRTDMNLYEWQGRKVLMATMMLLRQMAEKQKMKEKLDMATTEEQGSGNSLPEKKKHLNICMMTQNLLMMFLVLPQPKVLSLSVASTIMHGAGQAANVKRGSLQKLLDISKILQGLGIVRNVKVTMVTNEVVFAYQYVGQEVELVTQVEMEDVKILKKDLEDALVGKSEDTVNREKINERVCEAEERGDGTAKLKQPSMVVVVEEERKIVRLKFFGDEVEKMGDCRRKRKME